MLFRSEKQDGDCQQCNGKGCVACDARKQEADELTIAYMSGLYDGKKKPKREWVGLTDEEIEIIYADCNAWDKFEYERMLEAKLKEKNT